MGDGGCCESIFQKCHYCRWNKKQDIKEYIENCCKMFLSFINVVQIYIKKTVKHHEEHFVLKVNIY